MGVLTFGIVIAAGLLSTPGAVQYVPLDEGWAFETKGPWQSRVDHRDLLAMRHPWVPSESGNFAMAWREVTIPETWGAEIYLQFYSSDDYHGIRQETTPGSGFVGHRRRQILINSVPVWTQDVSDPVSPGKSPVYQVPVSIPEDKRTLRITLLAYDAVASTSTTTDDFYIPSKSGMTREADPDASRFRTTVYWGDLALISEAMAPTARPRPTEARVLQQHNRFWPPKIDTDPWAKQRTRLTISAPGGLPKDGFPVEMGIPFPEGVVADRDGFRLANDRKQAVYSQKKVTSTWSDASLRSALVQFPVTESTKYVALAYTKDSGKPSGKNSLEEKEGGLAISAGKIDFHTGLVDPIDTVRYRKNVVLKSIRAMVEVNGTVITGTNDDWEVVDEGPFHTRLRLQGRFEGLNASAGSYALYCSVYHGLPYMKIWFRYFNDTPTAQPLAQMDLHLELPKALKDLRLPHGEAPATFTLRQRNATTYEVDGTSHPANSPFFLQWSEGALVIEDFGALHPKGIRLKEDRMVVALVDGGTSPVTFQAGEAKSHTLWLAFGPTDGPQLAATVAQPPLLENVAYYGKTGAFGPAAPLADDNPLRIFLNDHYGNKSLPELGMATGVRHYPDDPYLGRPGEWSNNYNGRMSSLWHLWLATGDRTWFDRAAAVSRHLMDVAVVHSDIPGHDWLGALHGPGADHVAEPWNPLLRGEGFALFGQLTGNPDAETAFLGIADYCLRARAGYGGPNVRHWAGPFATLVAAYRESGEIAVLEGGSEYMAGMLRQTDRRRGTWINWHGSSTYPGNIPWMNAQLAMPLYLWYRQTGDLEAAQLLVGLAESMICENTPWDSPGAMKTYSPDPKYPDTTAYDPFIIPMIMAAYTLTEDEFFRDAARAQWKRWQENPEFQSAFNLSWHLPWLGATVNSLIAPEDTP